MREQIVRVKLSIVITRAYIVSDGFLYILIKYIIANNRITIVIFLHQSLIKTFISIIPCFSCELRSSISNGINI
uniref:Uncharacterized protein n=1 Tax=Heterorhabditis bacteriophora TaxID=37862 RepID=A0A1I7WR07_HETBA